MNQDKLMTSIGQFGQTVNTAITTRSAAEADALIEAMTIQFRETLDALGLPGNTAEGENPFDYISAALEEIATQINALQGADEALGGSLDDLASRLASELEDRLNELVDGSPAALDTLRELSAALGDDADFAATITSSLAGKADKSALGTAAGANVQTSATDLSAGRLARVDSVRRGLGILQDIYTERVILLHPLYTGTLLPYYLVDGKITATRGSTTGSNILQSVELSSSAAYSSHETLMYALDGTGGADWRAVSCMYEGVKYAALKIPYNASGYSNGVYFEGQTQGDDPNVLKIIDYYKYDTGAVLNPEIYESIAALPTRTTFRVGGQPVYHRANIVGPVNQTGGAPTGAIIERGRNDNGEYVRYADGTQICWGRLWVNALNLQVGGISPPYGWAYPAVFGAGNINAHVTNQSGWVYEYVVAFEGISNTALTSIYIKNVGTALRTQNHILHLTAIGRWY